jgi:hypothetical protein
MSGMRLFLEGSQKCDDETIGRTYRSLPKYWFGRCSQKRVSLYPNGDPCVY